jgi:hypothetical protein
MTPDLTKPIRGKWALPRLKRGRQLMPHLMSSDEKTFCGRKMRTGEIMEPGWNPEDHRDSVCPVCLEWWHLTTRPKHKEQETLPTST